MALRRIDNKPIPEPAITRVIDVFMRHQTSTTNTNRNAGLDLKTYYRLNSSASIYWNQNK